MQTFIPYPDFLESAKVLDYRRLGKQRVEAYQILLVLTGTNYHWKNHPAVKMWQGYEESLKLYINTFINEWVDRGYKNNMSLYYIDESKLVMPWWLGNEDFHRAMRSRLIEKNRDFYLPLFPNDDGFNNYKYLWPVNESKTFRMI
jgi:hypothetical protein